MPVNDYVATFRLTPITVGNRTFVEWWADFNVTSGTEQTMVAQIGDGVFVRGVEALEKKLASQSWFRNPGHAFSEKWTDAKSQNRLATIIGVVSHLPNAKRSSGFA